MIKLKFFKRRGTSQKLFLFYVSIILVLDSSGMEFALRSPSARRADKHTTPHKAWSSYIALQALTTTFQAWEPSYSTGGLSWGNCTKSHSDYLASWDHTMTTWHLSEIRSGRVGYVLPSDYSDSHCSVRHFLTVVGGSCITCRGLSL